MYERQPKNASEFAGFKRVSWGAIFAGTAAALMGYLVLSLLGLGIGLGSFNVGTANQSTAQGIGIGAAIWMAVVMIIALFFGGWVSARLAGMPFAADSILHGVVSFSLFVIVLVLLLVTGVGNVIGGAGSMLTQAYAANPNQAQNMLGVGQGGQQVDQEQARRVAEQVRAAASTGAIGAFIALVLAGGAAVFGGLVGTPRRAPVAEVTDTGI